MNADHRSFLLILSYLGTSYSYILIIFVSHSYISNIARSSVYLPFCCSVPHHSLALFPFILTIFFLPPPPPWRQKCQEWARKKLFWLVGFSLSCPVIISLSLSLLLLLFLILLPFLLYLLLLFPSPCTPPLSLSKLQNSCFCLYLFVCLFSLFLFPFFAVHQKVIIWIKGLSVVAIVLQSNTFFSFDLVGIV